MDNKQNFCFKDKVTVKIINVKKKQSKTEPIQKNKEKINILYNQQKD